MAEPLWMNTIIMDVSFQTNPDGNVMTILAGLWKLDEGHGMAMLDEQAVVTAVVERSPNVHCRVRDMFVTAGIGRKGKEIHGSDEEDPKKRMGERKIEEMGMKEILDLVDQLRKAEGEIGRLKERMERMERMTFGSSSPIVTDSTRNITADFSMRRGDEIKPSRSVSSGGSSDWMMGKETVGFQDGREQGKVDKDGIIDGSIHEEDEEDDDDFVPFKGMGLHLFSPPPQQSPCNMAARSDGDQLPSVVQAPPPHVLNGGLGVETAKKAFNGGKEQNGDGIVGSEVITLGMPTLETEWRLVGGRRRWRDHPLPPLPDFGLDSLDGLNHANTGVTSDRVERGIPPRRQSRTKPRSPLSSAVTICGRTEGFSYAAALKSARDNIDLETLGIKETRVRKTANGGLLIEVLGEDSHVKAEKLGIRIRDVLRDSAAVSCPTKKSDLLITGFDESVSAEEIVRVISSLVGCTTTDVRTGPIRTFGNDRKMVRVQLPVMAATKLVDFERVQLGWTMAGVELLKTRPLQCYRCWRHGHTQNMCHSVLDRRKACFKCGQLGHMVNTCRNMAHCVFCDDAGLKAAHRLGGPQCRMGIGKQRLITPSTKGSM